MTLELSSEVFEEQYKRRIVHIDMDAFYASVEQRDNPELRGKPLIVGGSPESRGVVAACSYEARQFGIHSAMPCSRAQRLCPHAIFVKPNIGKYRDVSKKIHAIFRQFTTEIEPLSLDEAYLDLSHHTAPATKLAQEIKLQIRNGLNLVASAGVSFNKFLAKLASDMDKPDGLFVIRPQHAQKIIDDLPVRKFHGIGPVTEKKMQAMGVHLGRDLRAQSFDELARRFKQSADYYYQIARGIDLRPVKSRRTRKSIGTETTYLWDISDRDEIEAQLYELARKVGESLKQRSFRARTIVLKYKFSDFKQITRSFTARKPVDFDNDTELKKIILNLTDQAELSGRSVRLLGVSCSKLSDYREEEKEIATQVDLDFSS